MNSQGVSHEELVETDQVEVDGMENGTSKVIPCNKNSFEEHNEEPIEESKEHIFQSPKVFSLERQFFKIENEKDNSDEGSRDDLMKVKTSPKEYEETVIFKEKAMSKDKDSSDKEENSKEEKLEEKKIIEPSKKLNRSPVQDDECCYLKLKDGDKFKFQEISYNLNSSRIYYGSKVRLGLGKNITEIVRFDKDSEISVIDTNKLSLEKI
jgi:hypothetical protein